MDYFILLISSIIDYFRFQIFQYESHLGESLLYGLIKDGFPSRNLREMFYLN